MAAAHCIYYWVLELGPLLRPNVATTLTNLLLYCSRLLARPVFFFFFSCLSTCTCQSNPHCLWITASWWNNQRDKSCTSLCNYLQQQVGHLNCADSHSCNPRFTSGAPRESCTNTEEFQRNTQKVCKTVSL